MGGIQESALDVIVYPLLQLMLRLTLVLIVSIGVYVAIYSYFLPKALVREPVYFDYTAKPQPLARVSLISAEKQWYYLKQQQQYESGTSRDSKRFLLPGSRYSIDLVFTLAKSPRNLDLGKFMVFLTTVDSTGDAIAKSARPVVMPYQSLATLVMDSCTKFPLRLVGLYQVDEASSIRVSVMNDYREPMTTGAFTELVELALSTSHVDLGEVFLSIMPVLGGVTYYMHYYPRWSFFIGVSIIMAFQVGLYIFYLVVTLAFRYVSSLSSLLQDTAQQDESDYVEQDEAQLNRRLSVSHDDGDVDQGGIGVGDGGRNAEPAGGGIRYRGGSGAQAYEEDAAREPTVARTWRSSALLNGDMPAGVLRRIIRQGPS